VGAGGCCTQQGVLVSASLMANGDIRTADGRVFTSAVAWCKSVLGVTALRLEAACRQVSSSTSHVDQTAGVIAMFFVMIQYFKLHAKT